MKALKDILYKVSINAVIGNTHTTVNELAFDSRAVKPKDVFIAIKGLTVDGHQYINKAIDNGAKVIVCEKMPSKLSPDVIYVEVNSTSEALAFMAANYYDNPSQQLQLVGVTGTNGKTTIATLLYNLFYKAGYKAGLLSTVKIAVGTKVYNTTHTTPDSITINRYLREMADSGADYCFMEVSSHGIHQNRTKGLVFSGAIFSNLSHDHLDYHNSFSEYRDIKKRFFDDLPKSAFALVNIDDKNGRYMLQNSKAKPYTYALKSMADYRAQILENQFTGLLLKLNENELWTRLIGEFNAYNLLAIFGTADIMGLEKVELLKIISELSSVEGRFQYLVSKTNITAIVDYAHTPDALQNVLETINSIRTKNENLITVVGAGGNRDVGKRPKMGNIAASLSNRVVFTSDNPRHETPEAIIKDIESGVNPVHLKKVMSITDRHQAIRTACQLAETNDIILIAGKGHETYQEIKGERFDFDDFKIVTETLNQLEK